MIDIKNTDELVTKRQILVIEERLKTESLSPDTIRHLNEKMRKYQADLDALLSIQ